MPEQPFGVEGVVGQDVDPRAGLQDECVFSSRRRHTRSLCDWSSDVCSSDLDRVAAYRREDAGREAEDEGEEDRAYRELDRRREKRRELRQDRLAGDDGFPEIAMQEA